MVTCLKLMNGECGSFKCVGARFRSDNLVLRKLSSDVIKQCTLAFSILITAHHRK